MGHSRRAAYRTSQREGGNVGSRVTGNVYRGLGSLAVIGLTFAGDVGHQRLSQEAQLQPAL